MPLQNDMNRISGCDQITINKGKAVFILIFEKCNYLFFPEEAEEISCLETGDFCNFIQGNRLSVMFGKGYCLLLGFSFITFIITVTL